MRLKISDVTFGYNDASGYLPIFDHASIDVPTGSMAALVGPSGSGKSTLLSLLSGELVPATWSVAWDDVEISKLDEKSRGKLRLTRASMLFQKSELLPHLTAHENVLVPRLLAELPLPKREEVENAFAEIGLAGKLDRYPDELSGWEQSRVSFLRAVFSPGEAIFADEPTSELDSKNAHVLLSLLKREQAKGKTVFLITHDDAMAEYADNVYRIDTETKKLWKVR